MLVTEHLLHRSQNPTAPMPDLYVDADKRMEKRMTMEVKNAKKYVDYTLPTLSSNLSQ